jgi:hypothetical protein
MDVIDQVIEKLREWAQKIVEAILGPDFQPEPEPIPVPVDDRDRRR